MNVGTRATAAVFSACAIVTGSQAASADEGFDKAKFAEPENIFSPAYFWMWNAKLDVKQLIVQLDDMRAHGLQSVCIHPFPKEFRPQTVRGGMEPPYLSDAYFDIVRQVVDHAAELGMNVWLYDEGGWPSGGACGQVAQKDSEGRFQPWFAGYGPDGAARSPTVWQSPYAAGRANYPSMVEPGATEAFMRLTHERYRKAIGRHFGKTVKFTFMDEPEMLEDFYGNNLGWTSDFAETFKARKGYDLMPYVQRLLDSRHAFVRELAGPRIDYFDVRGSLFVERFMQPIKDWCHANGLRSSGHLNGEDAPEWSTRYGHGNLFDCFRAMDIPGVDVIWRQLFPTSDVHAGSQAPFPRYASSVAHQMGGRLALSESFGIYGDSFTPNEMKWLVDYQLLRGINLFVFGYYCYSNAGQWMGLFEPHSGPIVPWWDFETPFFRYIQRTASLLAEGEPTAEIAVYYDQRAFWAGGAETEAAGRLHAAVASALDKMNCEYEFVDDVALSAAALSGGRLKVGKMSYSTLVLPTSKWMSETARAKMESFRSAGGTVLTTDTLAEAKPTCRIGGYVAPYFRVAKRVKGAETLYFIVNEIPCEIPGEIEFDEKGPVVRADPGTGRFVAVPSENGKVKLDFKPCESALLIVGAKADDPAVPSFGDPKPLQGDWTVARLSSTAVGKEDFVVTREKTPTERQAELGDWRGMFGEAFSGTARYRIAFESESKRLVRLDLGRVAWTCRARLNGRELLPKFFGPFVWNVTLEKGRNVLEVTVANLMANAVADDAVRDRIFRDFPPRPSYDARQRFYDKTNHQGGLIGPVTIAERLDNR